MTMHMVCNHVCCHLCAYTNITIQLYCVVGNHDQHEKAESGFENFFWQRIDKVLGYARIRQDDD